MPAKEHLISARLVLGSAFYGRCLVFCSYLLMTTEHYTYFATGIHVAIFCVAVYYMHKKKPSGGTSVWIYASTWIMFILGTVNIVCSTIFVCKTWVGGLVTGESMSEWIE